MSYSYKFSFLNSKFLKTFLQPWVKKSISSDKHASINFFSYNVPTNASASPLALIYGTLKHSNNVINYISDIILYEYDSIGELINFEIEEIKHSNKNSIYANINNSDVANVLKEFGGKNFSFFKNKLSESIVEKICPIGKEVNKLLKDENYLTKILEKGAQKANLMAKHNLEEIYKIIGLSKFTWKAFFYIMIDI